jgi:hypothetical protein
MLINKTNDYSQHAAIITPTKPIPRLISKTVHCSFVPCDIWTLVFVAVLLDLDVEFARLVSVMMAVGATTTVEALECNVVVVAPTPRATVEVTDGTILMANEVVASGPGRTKPAFLAQVGRSSFCIISQPLVSHVHLVQPLTRTYVFAAETFHRGAI